MQEAKILIEQWQKEYNNDKPHSALHFRPHAPEMAPPLTAVVSRFRLDLQAAGMVDNPRASGDLR